MRTNAAEVITTALIAGDNETISHIAGAVHHALDRPNHDEVRVTRWKLYPTFSRPGRTWHWAYSYSVNGAPAIEFGTGLVTLRRVLKRKFVNHVIVEEWR